MKARDLIALAVLAAPIAVPLALAESTAPTGKAYQTQQVEASIKKDEALRAAFDDQRRPIRTMVLYSDGDGDGSLMDMPVSLKKVIEDGYAASMKLRWRWRGLGAVNRVRFVDDNGNRVPDAQASDVTTPVELALEFVDSTGLILRTAPSTVPPRRP